MQLGGKRPAVPHLAERVPKPSQPEDLSMEELQQTLADFWEESKAGKFDQSEPGASEGFW